MPPLHRRHALASGTVDWFNDVAGLVVLTQPPVSAPILFPCGILADHSPARSRESRRIPELARPGLYSRAADPFRRYPSTSGCCPRYQLKGIQVREHRSVGETEKRGRCIKSWDCANGLQHVRARERIMDPDYANAGNVRQFGQLFGRIQNDRNVIITPLPQQ